MLHHNSDNGQSSKRDASDSPVNIREAIEGERANLLKAIASYQTVWLVSLQVLAFWSVWRWLLQRALASTEDAWGLCALATCVAFIVWRRRSFVVTRFSLVCGALFAVVYAIGYGNLTPLTRASIAMLSLGCTLSFVKDRQRNVVHWQVGITGLLLLSLPVIASLQFYGGYPLRRLVASVAAPLLRLNGYAVVADGACLQWGEQLIWIDAPCSGVRMLWAGLFLACAICSYFDLRAGKTLLATIAATLIILAGNIMRAVALFYLEAGIVQGAPSWLHEGIGVVSFAFVACAIVGVCHLLQRQEQSCLISKQLTFAN